MEFSLEYRENAGKGYNRRLRAQGSSPGIIYGKNDPLKVSMRSDLIYRLIQELHGTVQILDLKVEKEGEAETLRRAIIQDYQMSNYGHKVQHVDFREVDDDTFIHTDITIEPTECNAIKLGGILQVIRSTVPVYCKVKDVPEKLVANIIDLEYGGNVHVLDLDYPEGVTPMTKGRNFTILTIVGASAEEEATEGEEGEKTAEAAPAT